MAMRERARSRPNFLLLLNVPPYDFWRTFTIQTIKPRKRGREKRKDMDRDRIRGTGGSPVTLYGLIPKSCSVSVATDTQDQEKGSHPYFVVGFSSALENLRKQKEY
jgi:hypothetical protein